MKNILLVGSFHKAQTLAKSLLKQNYHVTIINKNREHCDELANIDNVDVIFGDGSQSFVLEEADIHSQDIVIALTQKDEDNLVICELCKKKYHVKKTVSLVNDHEKIPFFKHMGIDSTVCAIDAITTIIEQQTFMDNIENVILLENGNVNIVEIRVKPQMPIVNKKLSEISLPQDAIIGYIFRDNQGIVPRGQTTILNHDKLIIICSKEIQHDVFMELTGHD